MHNQIFSFGKELERKKTKEKKMKIKRKKMKNENEEKIKKESKEKNSITKFWAPTFQFWRLFKAKLID